MTNMRPASIHQFALPRFSVAGRSVVDIGTYDGATLMHPFYAVASERCGMDIDAAAIGEGKRDYPSLDLIVADADTRLPYPDERFDVVVSKGTLLFTDVRRSIAECYRIMKHGGDFYLTMHDWRHWLGFLRGAVKNRAWKRFIDHGYILGASGIYIAAGYVPKRPWKGGRESFQTKGSLKRDILRAGFVSPVFERTARDFIISAHKE
jgi:SAM-dependent methyltransferase